MAAIFELIIIVFSDLGLSEEVLRTISRKNSLGETVDSSTIDSNYKRSRRSSTADQMTASQILGLDEKKSVVVL